ncbi:MAG: hypothetical protein M3552_08880 [Planctomycetota bacterium]|nr:hypothetical protein [Planctomycetaceae bacterium]MDQ3330754.1 hypothetical protein [Planctomycetota bacterium]
MNDAPVATPDLYTTAEETPLSRSATFGADFSAVKSSDVGDPQGGGDRE